jgi:hypothetical protein
MRDVVAEALQLLSSQNFGIDVQAWREWWRTQHG